ncbi:MAG: LysR family transcriptional regulator [Desulfovibrio sp.]|uniref:LysR family transcriptional regulator n=1 Tax=Desulfovibrio sp. TaxID=885 RepID=UPI0025BCDFFC|nr:LysR family transcriptional regulator [Desulfovibrio sp.]MCI7567905.1 LysR family transcriptional regulator [Desulfovibrio sp.]
MLHPHIETFVLTVDCGSFSKAAAARFCSPVSIMNQINALEWHMGFAVLERTNHGVTLTPAGRSLYEDAKKMMVMAGDAVRQARRTAGVERAVVRLGTSFLRPCKPLLDIWAACDAEEQARFQISIVPFDDSPSSLAAMLQSLGGDIDCFVSPCDAFVWKKRYAICPLAQQRCCVALSRKHRLATKKRLTWDDLEGESLMLVRRGVSPVLDRLRNDIELNRRKVQIIDMPHIYDAEAFNLCEQRGCLMETPEIWADIHPSLVTLPVEWEYAMPYGVIYARNASAVFREFIALVMQYRQA